MRLQHGESATDLWRYDRDFRPAFTSQELCTWCCLRGLNMDPYLETMGNHNLHFHIKLTTIGLGSELDLSCSSMCNSIELLPFPLKVGSTTFTTRYGWDLKRHLLVLSKDQNDFWKSLRDDIKGAPGG